MEFLDDFSSEGFQRRNVDNLEFFILDAGRCLVHRIVANVLADFLQDRHECDVGFTSAGGRTNQQVPCLLESHWMHNTLDLVQMSC